MVCAHIWCTKGRYINLSVIIHIYLINVWLSYVICSDQDYSYRAIDSRFNPNILKIVTWLYGLTNTWWHILIIQLKSNIKFSMSIHGNTFVWVCSGYGLQQPEVCNEEGGSVQILVILTGILWSFLPLWEEATCARYWMTFFVFSVLPAPDSPLWDKRSTHKQSCSKEGMQIL